VSGKGPNNNQKRILERKLI